MSLKRPEKFSHDEVESVVTQWVGQAFDENISKEFRDEIISRYVELTLDVIAHPRRINYPSSFPGIFDHKSGATVPGWKEDWGRAHRSDLIEILELCGMDSSQFSKEAVAKQDAHADKVAADLTVQGISGSVKEAMKERGINMRQAWEVIGLWVEISLGKDVFKSEMGQKIAKSYLDFVRKIALDPDFINDPRAYPYREELVEIMAICGRDDIGRYVRPAETEKPQEKAETSYTIEDLNEEVSREMVSKGIGRFQLKEVLELWVGTAVGKKFVQPEMKEALVKLYEKLMTKIYQEPVFINDPEAYIYRQDLVAIGKLLGWEIAKFIRKSASRKVAEQRDHSLEAVTSEVKEKMRISGIASSEGRKVVKLWIETAFDGKFIKAEDKKALVDTYVDLMLTMRGNPAFINSEKAYPFREDLIAIGGIFGWDLRKYLKEPDSHKEKESQKDYSLEAVTSEVRETMRTRGASGWKKIVDLWVGVVLEKIAATPEMGMAMRANYFRMFEQIVANPRAINKAEIYPYRYELIAMADLWGEDLRLYVMEPEKKVQVGEEYPASAKEVAEKVAVQMERFAVSDIEKIVALWFEVSCENMEVNKEILLGINQAYSELVSDILACPEILDNPDLCDDTDLLGWAPFIKDWKKVWVKAHRDDLRELVELCKPKVAPVYVPPPQVIAAPQSVVSDFDLSGGEVVDEPPATPRSKALLVGGVTMGLAAVALAGWLVYKNFFNKPVPVRSLVNKEHNQPGGGDSDESRFVGFVQRLERLAEGEQRSERRGIEKDKRKKDPKDPDDSAGEDVAKSKDPIKIGRGDNPIPKVQKEDPFDAKPDQTEEPSSGQTADVIESPAYFDTGIIIDPNRPIVEQYKENIPKLVKALKFRIEAAIKRLDINDLNDLRMRGLLRSFDVKKYFTNSLVLYEDHPDILQKILTAQMPAIYVKSFRNPGLMGLAFKGHNIILLAYALFSNKEMQRVFSHELEHILVQTDQVRTKVMTEGMTELNARDLGVDVVGVDFYEKLVFRAFVMDLLDEKFLKHFYAFDKGGDPTKLLDEVFEGDESGLHEMVEGFLEGSRPMSDVWTELQSKMVAKMLEQNNLATAPRAKLKLIFLALSVKNGLITFDQAKVLYKTYVKKYEDYISSRTLTAFRVRDWKYFSYYDEPLTEEEIAAMKDLDDFKVRGGPGDSNIVDNDGTKEPGRPKEEEQTGPVDKFEAEDEMRYGRRFPEQPRVEPKSKEVQERQGQARSESEFEFKPPRVRAGHRTVGDDIEDFFVGIGQGLRGIAEDLYEDGIVPAKDLVVGMIDFYQKKAREYPLPTGIIILLPLYLSLVLLKLRRERRLQESRRPKSRGGGLKLSSAFMDNFLSEVAIQPGSRIVKQAIYLQARGEMPSPTLDEKTQLVNKSSLAAATQDLAQVFLGSMGAAVGSIEGLDLAHRTKLAHAPKEYWNKVESAAKPKAIRIIEERWSELGSGSLKGKARKNLIDGRKRQIESGDIVIVGYNQSKLKPDSDSIEFEYFSINEGTFSTYTVSLKVGEAEEILTDLKYYSATSKSSRYRLKSNEMEQCKLDFEMEDDEQYQGHVLLPNGMYCVRTLRWNTKLGEMIHSPGYKLVPTPFYKGVIPAKYFDTSKYNLQTVDFKVGEFTFCDRKTGEVAKIKDHFASVGDMAEASPARKFNSRFNPEEFLFKSKAEDFSKHKESLYRSLFRSNEREVVVGRDGYVRYIPKGMDHYLHQMPKWTPFGGNIEIAKYGGIYCWEKSAVPGRAGGGERWYDFSNARHLTKRVPLSTANYANCDLKEEKLVAHNGTVMLNLVFQNAEGSWCWTDGLDLFKYPEFSFEEVFKVVKPGEARYGFEDEVSPEDLQEGLVGDLYEHYELGFSHESPAIPEGEAKSAELFDTIAIVSRIRLNRTLLDREKIKKGCILKWKRGKGIGRRDVLKDWNEMPDFMGSRLYGQGDDFRAIDWQRTARSVKSAHLTNGEEVTAVDLSQVVGAELNTVISEDDKKIHKGDGLGDVYVKDFDYEAAKQVYTVVLAVESLSLENYAEEFYKALYALATRKNRLTGVKLVLTNHEVDFRETVFLNGLNVKTVDRVFDSICDQAQVLLNGDRNPRYASLRNVRTQRFKRALAGDDPDFISHSISSRIEVLSGQTFERQRGKIPGLKEGYHTAIGFVSYGEQVIDVQDHIRRKFGGRKVFKGKVA